MIAACGYSSNGCIIYKKATLFISLQEPLGSFFGLVLHTNNEAQNKTNTQAILRENA